jgi:hypothetical protein
MPQLNAEQLMERIQKRLQQLELGEAIAMLQSNAIH